LFTSAPPVALGLFDRTCSAKIREKYPSLYHASQNGEMFNIKEFWKWIGLSIYHSILLFWLPLGAMQTGVQWSHGGSDGYLVLGNTVYTLVVITTCLKAGLEMNAWTWPCHASIWGSILIWFLFLIVYSHIWPVFSLALNMRNMFEMIVSTPVFWFSLVLVLIVTLLLDFSYKSIKNTLFLNETEKIRIAEIKKKEESVYLDGGRRRILSESSRLLDNVTKRFRKNKQRQEQQANIELDAQHGYAFSQEEAGAVSQEDLIRRYDTTSRPRSSHLQIEIPGHVV